MDAAAVTEVAPIAVIQSFVVYRAFAAGAVDVVATVYSGALAIHTNQEEELQYRETLPVLTVYDFTVTSL